MSSVKAELDPLPPGPSLRIFSGGRDLPHNQEAAEAVVGGLLFNGHIIKEIRPLLHAEDLYHAPLEAVYEAMIALDDAGEPIDIITVAEHMRKAGTMGKLRAYKGEAYLAALANNVAQVENILFYVNIVREKSQTRQVILAGERLIQQGYKDKGDQLAATSAEHLLEISKQGQWPEPSPLIPNLLPVPPLDVALVPIPLRRWLLDVAERAQCPLEYVTVGAIVAAGSLIGRQIAMQPRDQDDGWVEFPNLWSLVIGPPGVLKTPALRGALEPIYQLQRDAWQKHRMAVAENEIKEVVRKIKEKHFKNQLEEIAMTAMPAEIEKLEDELREVQREKVIPRRYVTGDATIQKLMDILQEEENSNGILIHRDELNGFLQTFDKDGHENDRAFYLEGWAGDGSYTYETISRGTSHVDGLCLSLIGTIQPGPLALHIRRSLAGGQDDGLLQRFQLAVYPDLLQKWRDVDRRPDVDARDAACELYRRLTKLDTFELGAENRDGKFYFRFGSEAQDYARQFRDTLNNRVREEGKEEGPMRAHLAKYNKLFPALSLIFHVLECLAEGDGGHIKLHTAALAGKWCTFLEAHARRIYHMAMGQAEETPANLLAARIESGELRERFTARDVYIRRWGGLGDKEKVQLAAMELAELGWVRVQQSQPGPKGGRRSITYVINPLVLDRSKRSQPVDKSANP